MATLDELERLAKQATPGPWSTTEDCWIDSNTGRCVAKTTGNVDTYTGTYQGDANNAAFIAAVDPATVLALVAAVRAADDLLHEVAVPPSVPDPTGHVARAARALATALGPFREVDDEWRR